MPPTGPVPLVLIHGVGLDHTMWASLRAHLDPARPVIAYDTLGHGDGPGDRDTPGHEDRPGDGERPGHSDGPGDGDTVGHGDRPGDGDGRHPGGPFRLADYVEQLDGVLAHAGVAAADRVDVAGFSMGALIAQAFALARPERVRRLVLLATVHERTDDERAAVVARVADVRNGGYHASVAAAIERWFSPAFAAEHPDVIAAVRARMDANDVRDYADAYEVFATGDAELAGRAGEIDAPTLVVAGGDDPRSTPAMAQALAAAMPDARAVVLDGVRHCVTLEAPAAVARLVDEFLEAGR